MPASILSSVAFRVGADHAPTSDCSRFKHFLQTSPFMGQARRPRATLGGGRKFRTGKMNARMTRRRDPRNGPASGDSRGTAGGPTTTRPGLTLNRRARHRMRGVIRWSHPARGMIIAAEFIPVAEEGGGGRKETGIDLTIGESGVCAARVSEAVRWPDDKEKSPVNRPPVQVRIRNS